MVRALVELGPIVIAVFTVLASSINFSRANRDNKPNVRLIAILSMISAFMLIVAQSSWYVLVVVMDRLEDSVYSNYLWTAFNCVIMSLLILVNRQK